ncbi:hypothetical protein HNQ80_004151 [Anaerosolibacter carboniphilus]|uniref:Uncharacterized protein n=1 Tax=Anaerosolibacter carboniphilus TaxID=1417629 RepID=A0A841KWL4_9FIRM|nr:hypothetical protein [Anaerosolibacter carboniphilus]
MILVDEKGNIYENGNLIGRCSVIEHVNLKDNHCPQGYYIQLHVCLRCKHFRNA